MSGINEIPNWYLTFKGLGLIRISDKICINRK